MTEREEQGNGWLPCGIAVTRHALTRYRERAGSKASDAKIIGRIQDYLHAARRIGNGLYYSAGWVFVILNDKLITVHRPNARSIQKRVRKAFTQKKGAQP